jgi:hypothetical protein
MSDLKVLNFEREGWRDAARTLRKIADDLESGEFGACKIGVLALMTESREVKAFGFGPVADDLQTLALFRLGEQKLIDVLLDGGEG